MATGKRYYWLKLKESFMTSDTIDYFMSQPDGANYVVLYQMLCLKTINTDGRLSRKIGEVIIPYDIPKIQRDLKWFSADTIRVALNLYKSFGLLYEDVDGVLRLADHDNLVGSETDYSAQKRAQRNALPAVSGVDNVHSDVHTEIEIDNRDRDKEIREQSSDRETEDVTVSADTVCRTKDVRRIVECWNALGIGQVSKVSSDSTRGKLLRARVKDNGVDGVISAIDRIRESAFLQGQNKNGWIITFDWFLKPNNFVKVAEGNYGNHDGVKPERRTAMDDLREIHEMLAEEERYD